MRNVDIKISSVIENLDDSGLCESVERENVNAKGTLTLTPLGCTLEYDEESENGRCHSKLTLNGGEAALVKSGDISCTFNFSEGKETLAIYNMGCFAFDVKIKALRISYSTTPILTSIRLIYTMNIGGQEKKINLQLRAEAPAIA